MWMCVCVMEIIKCARSGLNWNIIKEIHMPDISLIS